MTAQLITKIRVEKLFGLYTYDIPPAGALPNAAILYGDNGVGKSTILRLVFHLLSAAGNRGHRSALYNSDFERLEVELSSGITLTAQMPTHKPTKLLTLEVREGDKRLAVWEYRPGDESRFGESEQLILEVDEHGRQIVRHRSRSSRKEDLEGVPRGEQRYLEALKLHVPTLFILNADRRLDSDSVSDPSDEVELRRVMQYGEPKRINELVVRSREIALSQALSAAARWISRKAVIGTNQGSINVHSVYGDVLRRLVSAKSPDVEATTDGSVVELLRHLVHIDTKSAQHARYELATHLPTNDFRRALSGKTRKTRLAAELLQPYIKSVEGRLEAVEPSVPRLMRQFSRS
jgi:hypothetical protein